MHGPQLAYAICRRVKVEPQVLEVGVTFDGFGFGVVKFVAVGELGMKLIERLLQRRVLFGLEPVLAICSAVKPMAAKG